VQRSSDFRVFANPSGLFPCVSHLKTEDPKEPIASSPTALINCSPSNQETNPMTIVQGYTQSILVPQLRSLNLNRHQREVVVDDVTQRLESVLSHWSDLPFRRTVLLLGTEEGSFWEPLGASIEVRSLVVVAVRNSLITDLNADRAYTPKLRSRRQFLPDERMPWITGEAVKFFQAAHLDAEQIHVRTDMFGSLPRGFPNAWHVLSLLGNSSDTEIECQLPMAQGKAMDLSELHGCAEGHTVIESGIDPSIDSYLMDALSRIERGEIGALFSPSFKHITRNPEKLLSVIDRILCCGGTVLTPNYLLSPTYLARRNPLLRPIHFSSELGSRLTNPEGLSQAHKEALASLEL
jgi:hypothetical protein